MRLFLSQFIEDIGVARQCERQRSLRFLDLLLCRLYRTIVSNRRRLDDRIHAVIVGEHCRIHLARRTHVHAPYTCGRFERRGAGDKDDLCAALRCLCRNGVAHASRRAVA